jgi:hypothetical protein
MREHEALFLSVRGSAAVHIAGWADHDQQEDCETEARPNLKLALIVVALAAALPSVPAIVSLLAQLAIPSSLAIGLNLIGTVVVAIKGASIAYALGRGTPA